MATMTKDSFLGTLRQSQLLTAQQIAAGCAAVGEDDQPLGDYLLGKGLLTRFQLRQLRAGATNFHIGKYVITDCIGRGGNGIVFKARHTLMNRFVAMKTLDTRNLHRANESLARFQREIDIVGRLEHPNVVRALDVLQTRTHLYLVLEYVSGKDLGAVVKERGPLPIHEGVRYALQAARGLEYAHGQGIIHRDLKPANLLLTRDGTVKLSDLGLAKLYDNGGRSDLTMKGLCLGTPEYMAPEQAEDAHAADLRSDIYSLGGTLFHLLTAQLPVQGNSYMHRLQHLLTAAPRPLLEVRPDTPPELAAVVDRMRERDRARRPASAAEVIALLAPFATAPLPEDPDTWSGQRKADIVLAVLTGHVALEEMCRRERITRADLERWQQTFVEAGLEALEPDAGATQAVQLRELHAKIGVQAMEIEQLRRRLA